MRSFSLLQESIIPYIPSVITQLTQKLLAVSKVKNHQKQAENRGPSLPSRAALLKAHVCLVVCVLLGYCKLVDVFRLS